jgi:hypothetical protein
MSIMLLLPCFNRHSPAFCWHKQCPVAVRCWRALSSSEPAGGLRSWRQGCNRPLTRTSGGGPTTARRGESSCLGAVGKESVCHVVQHVNMTIKGHGRVTGWIKPVGRTREREPGWYKYVKGGPVRIGPQEAAAPKMRGAAAPPRGPLPQEEGCCCPPGGCCPQEEVVVALEHRIEEGGRQDAMM